MTTDPQTHALLSTRGYVADDHEPFNVIIACFLRSASPKGGPTGCHGVLANVLTQARIRNSSTRELLARVGLTNAPTPYAAFSNVRRHANYRTVVVPVLFGPDAATLIMGVISPSIQAVTRPRTVVHSTIASLFQAGVADSRVCGTILRVANEGIGGIGPSKRRHVGVGP